MHKTELIDIVSKKTGVNRDDVRKILNSSLESMMDVLVDGDKIQLIGFGTFYTAVRPAKVGRSMKTGLPMDIPPSLVVRFKPGKILKRDLMTVYDNSQGVAL